MLSLRPADSLALRESSDGVGGEQAGERSLSGLEDVVEELACHKTREQRVAEQHFHTNRLLKTPTVVRWSLCFVAKVGGAGGVFVWPWLV